MPDMAGMAAPRCCACPIRGKAQAKEKMQSVRRIVVAPEPKRVPYSALILLDAELRFNVSYSHLPVCPLAFSQRLGLCYNRRAVKYTGKQVIAPAAARGVVVEQSGQLGQLASEASTDRQEDASRYCPVCSQRLESRRCKLICNVCGYYMSCADYY